MVTLRKLAKSKSLSFWEQFLALDIDNIVTRFYCDYLFKGLVLDKKVNKWIRRNKLADF